MTSSSSDGVARRVTTGVHRRSHRLSNTLMVAVAIGALATVFTVVMVLTDSYPPMRWQPLTMVFAVPSALGAAFWCLARGREQTRDE